MISLVTTSPFLVVEFDGSIRMKIKTGKNVPYFAITFHQGEPAEPGTPVNDAVCSFAPVEFKFNNSASIDVVIMALNKLKAEMNKGGDASCQASVSTTALSNAPKSSGDESKGENLTLKQIDELVDLANGIFPPTTHDEKKRG